MSPVRSDQLLGKLRWVVVCGQRDDAFRALGRHAAPEIRSVAGSLPEMASLRRYVATGRGRARFRAVADASREAFPVHWEELRSMSEGARVDLADLLLLTLRGDLLSSGGGECSDLGWTDGRRTLLGHNEDGDPSLLGRSLLLTLRLEDEPAVTTWWYPGFLPGNTFTMNEHGMCWGVDAIQITHPAVAPGRGFLARALQTSSSFEAALETLEATPTAGGFAYVVGQVSSGRVLVVEHAGEAVACIEAVPPERPFVWHTNHLCQFDPGLDRTSTDSARRAGVLERLVPPRTPRVGWFLNVLQGNPPEGVRASGAGGAALTLCTVVVDLSGGVVSFVPHGGHAITLSVGDLLSGKPSEVSAAEEGT